MKLKVSEIPKEGREIETEAASDRWFEAVLEEVYREDYRKGSPARLDLRVLKSCDNVSLTGTVEVDVTPGCDRCLETFPRHLTIPLRLDLAPRPEAEDGEEEATDEKGLSGEDLNFAFYRGDEIDLEEIIREMLLLEVPLKNLCSEGCKGLCPRCGANLNTHPCSCSPSKGDPRFSVLGRLFRKG